MKTKRTVLAWSCAVLLILYPVSALFVHTYLTDDYYGIMAALFALNAGAAFFVERTYRLSGSGRHVRSELRYIVLFIGLGCALLSAQYWMTDEVHNVWLRLGIMSPVGVILLLLMWFALEVDREQGKSEDKS